MRAPGVRKAEPGATPRRRHPPEVRRALIIEAAKELIAEQGLARATAREIAARCEISTGTLTHHFSSMDELLVEALRSASKEVTDHNLASSSHEPTAAGKLRVLIDTALPDNAQALRNWRLWLEYWARAVHEPDLAAAHSERYREWRGSFERVIHEGIESGEFGRVDVASAAREIVALFDGLGIEAAIGDEAISVAEARRILHGWVQVRLGADVGAGRRRSRKRTR